MDNRNVFVAIALSMAVLLFWGAFFETPKNTVKQNNTQKVEQTNNQSSIAPNINQPVNIKKITREEAINKMKRALDEFVIEGITTTIPFHRKLMDNKDYLDGNYTTKFMNEFDLEET